VIHPDTELRFVSAAIGLGVFATRPIPRGTITYVIDPFEVRVPRSRFRAVPPLLRPALERYAYVDARGDHVMSWDHARYVNHCCEPNTISTGWGFEIALRDIAAGEELTDDYGLFNPDQPMPVSCGRPCPCRGRVEPDDLERFADIWDARIRAALDFHGAVAQPLAPLLDTRTRAELEAFVAGRGRYRSVRELERRPAPRERGAALRDVDLDQLEALPAR
jgi:hypothetical protein